MLPLHVLKTAHVPSEHLRCNWRETPILQERSPLWHVQTKQNKDTTLEFIHILFFHCIKCKE